MEQKGMSISRSFSRFINSSEQAEEVDEFVPIMTEFVVSVGAKTFLYTNETPEKFDLVLGHMTCRQRRSSSVGRPLSSNHAHEATLLNNSDAHAMFGEIFNCFNEPMSSGYACCVHIATASFRQARLVLLGVEQPAVFRAMNSERVLPLLGMECDRRLRRLIDFRSEHEGLLSLQERRCLVWAANGKTMEDIGEIVGITRRTVEFHLTNARRKLEATNMTHAACKALRSGVLDGVYR